jgi:hypothetical protein
VYATGGTEVQQSCRLALMDSRQRVRECLMSLSEGSLGYSAAEYHEGCLRTKGPEPQSSLGSTPNENSQ